MGQKARFVLFGSDDERKFHDLADSLRDIAEFGRSDDEADSGAVMKVFRKFDESPVQYTGDLEDVKAMSEFVTLNYVPVLPEFSADWFKAATQRQLPFVWLHVDLTEDGH